MGTHVTWRVDRTRRAQARSVFAKGIVLIAGLGLIACGLLAQRQSRLQAGSELTQAQLRIGQLDERLWLIRTDIAGRVSPASLREDSSLQAGLTPMIPDQSEETTRTAAR